MATSQHAGRSETQPAPLLGICSNGLLDSGAGRNPTAAGGKNLLRVLVACEYSGTVRAAFAALGHYAMSCDILPTDRPGNHYQGDVRDVLDAGWDIMIAHPPCTYLNRAGWHWVNKPDCATLPLKGEPRRRAAAEAAQFFLMLLSAPIPKIAVENPRPICHANLPPSTQSIQPWQFGHGEVKETHLWLKNLPKLTPTNIVDGREQRIFKMSPGPNRAKARSLTYSGIAAAMASQWSDSSPAPESNISCDKEELP